MGCHRRVASAPDTHCLRRIQGALLTDAQGGVHELELTRSGPMLHGGLLSRKGAALVRLGRSGCVQIYLRATEQD